MKLYHHLNDKNRRMLERETALDKRIQVLIRDNEKEAARFYELQQPPIYPFTSNILDFFQHLLDTVPYPESFVATKPLSLLECKEQYENALQKRATNLQAAITLLVHTSRVGLPLHNQSATTDLSDVLATLSIPSTDPVERYAEFTCFPNLPLELRLKIWEKCWEEDGASRLHKISSMIMDNRRHDAEEWLHVYRCGLAEGFLAENRKPDSTLATCYESRAHYLLKSGLIFRYGAFVNFDDDVFRYCLFSGLTPHCSATAHLKYYLTCPTTKSIQKLALRACVGSVFGEVLRAFDEHNNPILINPRDPISILRTLLPGLKELIFIVEPSPSSRPNSFMPGKDGFMKISAKSCKNNFGVRLAKSWLTEAYPYGPDRFQRLKTLLGDLKIRFVYEQPEPPCCILDYEDEEEPRG